MPHASGGSRVIAGPLQAGRGWGPGGPYISVVLSFRNEEAIIPELIARLREVFATLRERGEVQRHELIFVNDESTDRSEEMLRREAASSDDIRLINMSRNFGVAPCVLAGMAYAQGDAVIYMDADLQDPPLVILELIREWRSEEDVDVVHTLRISRAGESAFKKALTRLGYHLLRMSSSIDLPVEAGDYKLLSRRVVDHLLRFKEKSPYIRGLIRWVGFKQRFVYYNREARFAGETKFPVLGLKVMKNFFESALIAFSSLPLRVPAFFGVLLSGVGALYLVGLVIARLLGHPVAGWSAVLGAVLVVGGMQLIAIGLVGLYVYAILQEARERPTYIVKDTIGFPPAASSEYASPLERNA